MKKMVNFSIKYFTSIFLVVYSLTIGIFTGKGRGLVNDICNYFDPLNIDNKTIRHLPLISSSELIYNEPITIIEPRFVSGNVEIGELIIMNGLIMKYKPKKIFEFGTFDGRTTLNMAMNSPVDCVIYTLNLPNIKDYPTKFDINEYDRSLADLSNESGSRFLKLDPNKYSQMKKIIQLYGDSAAFDFSQYFNTIDFVFIDAAHTYEYVLNDSRIALKLLRKRKGIILWHDYKTSVEVAKAIDTFKGEDKNLNIKQIDQTNFAFVNIN